MEYERRDEKHFYIFYWSIKHNKNWIINLFYVFIAFDCVVAKITFGDILMVIGLGWLQWLYLLLCAFYDTKRSKLIMLFQLFLRLFSSPLCIFIAYWKRFYSLHSIFVFAFRVFYIIPGVAFYDFSIFRKKKKIPKNKIKTNS